MITTANYLLIAYVGGEQYHFEYEDCGDMWEALEQFWHEDYDLVLNEEDHTECFAVDVVAMDVGKAIKRYEVAFDAAHYHAFFDHGRTVSGPYTLDEFSHQLTEIRKELDAKKPFRNDVTSLMFYMWNAWSEEECEIAFKDGDYNHFWKKWCEAYDTMKGPRGAAELFYMMLSDTNRDKLVARALECYDGMTEK